MTAVRVLTLALGVSLLGCGSAEDKWKANRPKVAPATGTITLNGKPLDAAQVVFIGDGTTNNSASGLSQADGSFVLSAFPPDEGAVPGKYKVMIVKSIVPEVQDMHGENEVYVPPTKATLLVPRKYTDANTSGLSIEIPEAGKTDIVLELKQ